MSVHQGTYMDHATSTERLPDGTWRASFRRIDTIPLIVSGIFRDFWESGPCLSEADAVEAVKMKIDIITKRQKRSLAF